MTTTSHRRCEIDARQAGAVVIIRQRAADPAARRIDSTKLI
jgi:hypothetical protein